MSRAKGTSWLGPALAVALLWAPLPGMAAVWVATRAEAVRGEGQAAFDPAARRARAWVFGAFVYGGLEFALFGALAALRMVWVQW